ncbi:U4/U5/U6 small nuclear ribonucleoprotein prp3 [Tieghemiomyces parasiticus]|uniref:U4/U5/U6 small nuclear ribonucleoprotein prp3 n=1 Tax=Tieghemiomyces parasiticus TaxID=78921 RepID=A0A9W8E314_9FUNG|nr:U4/U5/U6 small nuclear ribonucleoprotein prp3 [Tieghemiomyces parasiticus]
MNPPRKRRFDVKPEDMPGEPPAKSPRTSGLNKQLHPSLQARPTTSLHEAKPTNPKLALLPRAELATVKANRLAAQKHHKLELLSAPTDFTDVTKNPYFDPNLGGGAGIPRERKRRGFHFVPQGRYIQEANELRAQAQLEALKLELAERVKNVGLTNNEESRADDWLMKPLPPAVEWWDAPLLKTESYAELGNDATLVDTPDSLVSRYVQHPVPTRSVVQEVVVAYKPLMLTKKERKKLRRQRRAEALRDRQDKIRLGLLPPDPPKVKLSNLMRVLANESVQDPTKVEAEVRRQVAARQEEHEKANHERQLTDEQRRAKRQAKLAQDEAQGIYCMVFKVQNLSHPQHKYKVDTNAQQLQLTGVAIMNPTQGLVVVEGGAKSLKAYKKLMLRRIQWDMDPGDSDSGSDDDEEDGNRKDKTAGLAATQPSGPNYCALIWEGQITERRFKKFTLRLCPTDERAMTCLAYGQADQFWTLARNYSHEDALMEQAINGQL